MELSHQTTLKTSRQTCQNIEETLSQHMEPRPTCPCYIRSGFSVTSRKGYHNIIKSLPQQPQHASSDGPLPIRFLLPRGIGGNPPWIRHGCRLEPLLPRPSGLLRHRCPHRACSALAAADAKLPPSAADQGAHAATGAPTTADAITAPRRKSSPTYVRGPTFDGRGSRRASGL